MLNKITGPGLFRLFLALLVFFAHITRFLVGGYAVFVFFCLSGFWVYRMYLGRYSTTRKPYLTYMVSRAWRLLPTFWLVSAITLVFLYLTDSLAPYWVPSDRPHLIVSTLSILGYNTMLIRPVGPAWSLDIEMQFYLIAPLFALVLSSRKVPAIWILFGAATVSLASEFLGFRESVSRYLLFFVIGMVAASLDWRPTGKLVLGSLGLAAAAVLCCMASRWRGLLLGGTHPGPLFKYSLYANAFLALSTVPYAIYTTRQKGFRADGMFADLSYVIYLLHWCGVMWIYKHPGSLTYRLASAAMVGALVLGLSFVIWRFYDRPINVMRSRWVSARRKPQLATGKQQKTELAPSA